MIFGRTKSMVDAREAHRLSINEGYVILDVRTDDEWSEGHPPGSIHIALESLPQHIGELEGKKVLAFCRSGSRSNAATRFLDQHDIEAHNVRGGLLEWVRAGLPLERGSQQ